MHRIDLSYSYLFGLEKITICKKHVQCLKLQSRKTIVPEKHIQSFFAFHILI